MAEVSEVMAEGGEFALVATPSFALEGNSASCFCSRLFADGFETGDTSRWSIASP